MSDIFDYQSLMEFAAKNRKTFRDSPPFPNISLENFILDEVLDKILAEFPDTGSSYWKMPGHVHVINKQVADLSEKGFKINTFGPFCRSFFDELHSAPFIYFMEQLTSTRGLVGDPYLAEAGFANSLRGGTLDIHADFSRHDHLRLERRINLLLYLNKDWREEYKGQLGLYDQNLKLCKHISPIAKRCFIFETQVDPIIRTAVRLK